MSARIGRPADICSNCRNRRPDWQFYQRRPLSLLDQEDYSVSKVATRRLKGKSDLLLSVHHIPDFCDRFRQEIGGFATGPIRTSFSR